MRFNAAKKSRAPRVVGKESDKYYFFQGGCRISEITHSTSGRSLTWLRPDVECVISEIQAPLEKVVFVRLFPYYLLQNEYGYQIQYSTDNQSIIAFLKWLAGSMFK